VLVHNAGVLPPSRILTADGFELTQRILSSPAEGADTVVWLAVCQPAPTPSGAFWFDREPRGTHYLPWTREDQPTRDRLWEQCQRFAGIERSNR
jgi:hypothetical protein